MSDNVDMMPLWDGEPPCSSKDDDFKPYMEIHKVETDNAVGAVMVCPGGGYGHRAEHEGKTIAEAFNSKGIHAFVVHYRVSPHRHPAPLLDASKAIRIVRANAREWKVKPDKIAVCGFSAGGHLACSLGVLYGLDDLKIGDELESISNRPDAMILSYAVISSDKPHRHEGSFKNLLGEEMTAEELHKMSPEKHVDDATPPAFLWHTAEDPGVSVENALIFGQALNRNKIPFEAHIFPFGRHGLGLAYDMPRVAQWFGHCVDWLLEMNWR